MSDLIQKEPFITANRGNSSLDISPFMPQNIEAEQGLLGSLLVNNDVYDKISQIIYSKHFLDLFN